MKLQEIYRDVFEDTFQLTRHDNRGVIPYLHSFYILVEIYDINELLVLVFNVITQIWQVG